MVGFSPGYCPDISFSSISRMGGIFARQRWTSLFKPMPELDLHHVNSPKVSHS